MYQGGWYRAAVFDLLMMHMCWCFALNSNEEQPCVDAFNVMV